MTSVLRRARRGGAIAILSLATFACEGDEPTEVLVVVDAESPLDTRIDRVEIAVQGGETATILDPPYTETIEPPTFPFRIAIVPRGGDAERIFRVEVVAYQGTDIVGTVRARGQFIENRLVQLPLLLEACCADIARTCSATQTCRSCMCVDETVEQDAGMPMRDGGGIDAEVPEGGGLDGGAVDDGGGVDGGPPTGCSVGPVEDTGILGTRVLDVIAVGTGFALVYTSGSEVIVESVGSAARATASPSVGGLDAVELPGGAAIAGTPADGSLLRFDFDGASLATTPVLPVTGATAPAIAVHTDGSLAYTINESSLVVFASSSISRRTIGDGRGTSPIVWSPTTARWVVVMMETTGNRLATVTVDESGTIGPSMVNASVLLSSASGLVRLPDDRLLFSGIFGPATSFVFLDASGASTGGPAVSVPYPRDSGTNGAGGIALSADGRIAAVARWISHADFEFAFDVAWIDTTTRSYVAVPAETQPFGSISAGAADIARNGDQWMVAFNQQGGTISTQLVCPPPALPR